MKCNIQSINVSINIYTKLFAIILFLFSCKKNVDLEQNLSKVDSPNLNQNNTKIYDNCEELVSNIVKSSNANAVKNFNDLKVRIESQNEEKIIIELYVLNDISENPSVKNMSNQTVGWLEFFPSSKKLQDITNDPENPLILEYNKSILENIDINNLCKINTTDISKTSLKNDVKCYEKNDEKNYIFSKICSYSELKNKDYLYKQILEKYTSKDLLKNLPRKDTAYSTSNVLKIEYSIKPDTIKIRQFFDGGETYYLIYLKNNKSTIEERSLPD